LSLASNVCSTISDSGALSTLARSEAATGAAPAGGAPRTAIPARASIPAKAWAAALAGSGLRWAEPRRTRPSSTHNAEMGLTTPPVT